MRRLSVLTIVAAIAMATLVVGMGVRATTALFAAQETAASSWSTVACFNDDSGAPLVSASVISKPTLYLPGFIRQGAGYYVYANAPAGSGGPATRVSADVRSLTPGEFIAPLTAGAYSVGGVAYGWRSGLLTASTPLGEAAYAYSVSVATASSQCRTAAWTANIDNTAPVPTDIQPNNRAGGTSGRPELGDPVVYTFSEVIDPESVFAGWTGASMNVVAVITNSGSNDVLTVWHAATVTQVGLGSTDLDENYVGSTRYFGASGTPSTMVQTGATITVTLGTASGSVNTDGSNATAVWTPSGAPTDRAANATTTPTVTESGGGDRNF